MNEFKMSKSVMLTLRKREGEAAAFVVAQKVAQPPRFRAVEIGRPD
jgi:hypothetical protein